MKNSLLTRLQASEPLVMGILNVTPDSFSDGGQFTAKDSALLHAKRMVDEGAGIIDVGGESTRPGAQAVSIDEELERTIPVINLLRDELDVMISIDTSKPEVMKAAVDEGACLVNDVRALREPGAIEMVAQLDVPVCLMHMQGKPRTMQAEPHYDDVVSEVKIFLKERMQACKDADIRDENLMIDPGFGFGKTLEHNLKLFQQLEVLHQLNAPILVGVSRKSMIGTLLDRPVEERVPASVAMAALATWMGVKVLRVHDVKETVDAVRMIHAIKTV